jgi:3-oxoacyl-[acyl-carrier protein] reductase
LKSFKANVLIMGGSGGVGLELARYFLGNRDRVAIHYFTSKNAAEALLEEMGYDSESDEAFSCYADLRHSSSLETLFLAISKKWPHLDVLINCGGSTEDALFSNMTFAKWDEIIRVNLTGLFLTMKFAANGMLERKKGHIINIASRSGLTGRIGQSNYAASKAGVIALTKSAALEWGREMIQVNAVFPGYLPTPMGLEFSPRRQQAMVSENSLRKPSSVKEVAEFIFNLSRMKNVSGQVFNLDSRIL